MSVYADVIRYRELFGSLFRRDIRAKYRGSFLGLGIALLVVSWFYGRFVFGIGPSGARNKATTPTG